ncbi:uncharacterized protein B0I36DRAFT_357103 [Microdochium trichocladiopsis]|uniref:Uncharacterized protein n=1 Tax=Microdochium trichocladiopsis TaxID=1682393 RepID=A0A9P8YI63_9PEZI|nr:uncharacterized protein B0I36DRAFT_357103 [Microdochium trichocladiopsis]KAH7039706.1 hypothetical protein B0I36DRAFT_357103 [Microdochium trichocladiopsis]
MAGRPRMPAQLHTPTHSFSEAPIQTPDSTAAGKASAQERREREQFEFTKRLTDQKFNIALYPDPLLPRQLTQEQHFPAGVTTEMEAYLQNVAARVKGMAVEKE